MVFPMVNVINSPLHVLEHAAAHVSTNETDLKTSMFNDCFYSFLVIVFMKIAVI